MIELNQNLRCLFPDYRLPSFLKSGVAERHAVRELFFCCFIVEFVIFLVLRARLLIRHSCNFIETVVTSKTEIFYIYFSVDTKKARIFGENEGF